MKPFKPFSIKKTFAKFRYPFIGDKNPVNNIEFQPKYSYINENDVDYQAEVASTKLTLYLVHGLFILLWYSMVIGCYCWYFLGYCVYWAVASLFGIIKGIIKK